MSIMATARPIEEKRAGDWACTRCGRLHSNGHPHASGWCESCRDVADDSKVYLRGYRKIGAKRKGLAQPCWAWQGDFDDLDHPITPEGDLVAPGGRLCGHTDCVAPTHIVAEEVRDVA